MKLTNFAKYAWGVLLYNLLVVLWGAYVRATGSGAGCGSHWPLCNGVVLPRSPNIETVIEFVHRLTSGLALVLVIILVLWAWRAYPRRHNVRLGAGLSLVFVITEALVGAGLVLFEWVANDASTARVVSMAIHLINTFLLLASLTLTAWWASGGEPVVLHGHGIGLWLFVFAFLSVLALSVFGAMTALGDTLFPVRSLGEGILQDFTPTAHFLVRLRVWHPLIAIVVGVFLGALSILLLMFRANPLIHRFVRLLTAFFVLQLVAGLVNLLLLAPVWMQLVHLLLADTVWIILVLLAVTNFAESEVCQDARPA
ncbi:MAG: COX15/CtaA family protein [Chloroflexota bacterium]